MFYSTKCRPSCQRFIGQRQRFESSYSGCSLCTKILPRIRNTSHLRKGFTRGIKNNHVFFFAYSSLKHTFSRERSIQLVSSVFFSPFNSRQKEIPPQIVSYKITFLLYSLCGRKSQTPLSGISSSSIFSV